MLNNSSSQVSLSEASVCSSMDIRTPDLHPAADASVTQQAAYMTQQCHEPIWQMPGNSRCLSYSSIKMEYDDTTPTDVCAL